MADEDKNSRHERDVARLWVQHEEFKEDQKDKTASIDARLSSLQTEVSAGFSSLGREIYNFRDTHKPTSPFVQITALIAIVVVMAGGIQMYVDKAVQPYAIQIEMMMGEDDDMNVDLDIMEGEMALLWKAQGKQEEMSRWHEIVLLRFVDRQDEMREFMREVHERAGRTEATQEWLKNWLGDVDKGGSRKWISKDESDFTSDDELSDALDSMRNNE